MPTTRALSRVRQQFRKCPWVRGVHLDTLGIRWTRGEETTGEAVVADGEPVMKDADVDTREERAAAGDLVMMDVAEEVEPVMMGAAAVADGDGAEKEAAAGETTGTAEPGAEQRSSTRHPQRQEGEVSFLTPTKTREWDRLFLWLRRTQPKKQPSPPQLRRLGCLVMREVFTRC